MQHAASAPLEAVLFFIFIFIVNNCYLTPWWIGTQNTGHWHFYMRSCSIVTERHTITKKSQLHDFFDVSNSEMEKNHSNRIQLLIYRQKKGFIDLVVCWKGKMIDNVNWNEKAPFETAEKERKNVREERKNAEVDVNLNVNVGSGRVEHLCSVTCWNARQT